MGVQRTAWLSVEWTEDVAPEEALILSLGGGGGGGVVKLAVGSLEGGREGGSCEYGEG